MLFMHNVGERSYENYCIPRSHKSSHEEIELPPLSVPSKEQICLEDRQAQESELKSDAMLWCGKVTIRVRHREAYREHAFRQCLGSGDEYMAGCSPQKRQLKRFATDALSELEAASWFSSLTSFTSMFSHTTSNERPVTVQDKERKRVGDKGRSARV